MTNPSEPSELTGVHIADTSMPNLTNQKENPALRDTHNMAIHTSVAHGNYGIKGVTDNKVLVHEAIGMMPEIQHSRKGLEIISQHVAA